MIEVQDCDARLPSSGDAADLYLDQLVRLSVIVGRVQKNIYTCVPFPRTASSCAARHVIDVLSVFTASLSPFSSADRPAYR